MCEISVIVPVYNVEEFLRPCVESLLNQTFKDIEIILVNDGSTDGSAAMCDALACTDNRIKVIHQTNGGLSDARNKGLDCARGNYIAFVDSDDWVSPRMLETLYKSLVTHKVKIATCGRYIATPDDRIRQELFHSSEKKFSTEEALQEVLFSRAIDVAAWDKLYHKELFEGIRFPKGENNEDIATFYKLFEVAGEICHCGESLYYYRTRSGSITQSKYRLSDREQLFQHLADLKEFLLEYYPSLQLSFDHYYNMNVYYMLHRCLNSSFEEKEKEKMFLLNQLSLRSFLTHPQLPLKDKVIGFLMAMHVYKGKKR